MTPKVAIIDHNTLAAIGLRQLLQTVMPIMTVDIFGSFSEFQATSVENYFHYFVAMSIVSENHSFFTQYHQKTIVLSMFNVQCSMFNVQCSSPSFHTLCVDVPEDQLVRSLLVLQQHAHRGGKNLPPMPPQPPQKLLSDREIEVMKLIVQGYINKEIADKLSIALSTVITHRKNIMDKLGVKSVSALTIYAVMHGYVQLTVDN